MAHNHDTGDSGTGVDEDRPQNLSLDQMDVFHRAHLLVPPEYRHPHEWH
jgi:hypothetical protein